MATLTKRDQELIELFESWYDKYHRPKFLNTDPLQVAHRYQRPEDQEVVALLAAGFASGNIKSILAFLEKLLSILGPEPAAWLREHTPQDVEAELPAMHHRWVTREDIAVVLASLGLILRTHGTIGSLWRALDQDQKEDICEPLSRFSRALTTQNVEPLSRRVRTANRYDGKSFALSSIDTILFTSPERGSACKRMHLFLRWMARPRDGVDLGLWTEFLHPARLYMPVDTHVLRLTRMLRMTRRKVADRKTAEHLTKRFRKLCPEDPCRYDFSFVRVGIEELKTRTKRNL